MANNDIEINLKTIAQTGDVQKLIDYIKSLGKELKSVGGDSARGLRDQLAPLLRQLANGGIKGDALKSVTAEVAKIQSLGSLDAIDKNLTKFGTAQAKAIQQTVKEMRGAISGGALSNDTIELLSSSLSKFVEQANKLPPVGLKKLAADIQKTISNTQELQEVIAAANDIEFNVKTDGTGSLDELQHKIEVIANAKNLDDGIKELNAALLTLDSKEAEAVGEQLEKIKKILEGELGQKQVKALNNEMKELAKVSSSLSSRELQRIGGALTSVQSQAKTLGDEMKKTGNEIADSFNAAETVTDALGISIDNTTKSIAGLLAKIPGIGKAFSALPLGWVLSGIAAIVSAFKSWLDTIHQNQRALEELNISTLQSTIENINKSLEVQNHLRDIAVSREKEMLEVMHEQENAQRELQKSILERKREEERANATTDTQRSEIDRRYERQLAQLQTAGDKSNTSYEVKKMQNELADLQAELEDVDVAAKDSASTRKSASEEIAKINKERQGGFLARWWRAAKEGKSIADYDAERDEYLKSYSSAADSASNTEQANLKKRNELQVKIEALKKRLENATAKNESGLTVNEQRDEENRKMREAQQKEAEAREKRRIESLNRQRAREKELYDYDREMAETSYQRNKRSPWQNEVQQLAEAEKMLKRYRQEEKEALEEREKVMKEVAAQGGWKTITEEQEFRLNNATSDLIRARSSRYQEQSTVDQLQKQMHDRRFDESEARHALEKEDYDWKRGLAYQRANYAQKLAMDRKRYEAARKEYATADAAIQADNAGTQTLSPEERKVMERRRNEARAYLTESRNAIASAEYEGDAQKAQFYSSVMKQSNRLTAMGLGGDVANWDKQTATNTRRIYEKNSEMVTILKSGSRQTFGTAAMTWGI